VTLRLDHVMLRSPDPERELAALLDAGFPLLEEVTAVGGLRSGIVRAGAIDLEVLAVGADPPAVPAGYGLGFTATEDLWTVAAQLRRQGLATSLPVGAAAGAGADRRRWSALFVAGLLPEPFKVPFSTTPPGRLARASALLAGQLARIGPVAAAASRNAGRSMVVVTEYGFDAEGWRRRAGEGPATVRVDVAGAHPDAWRRLGPLAGPEVALIDAGDGPPGPRRLVMGEGWPSGRRLELGGLELVAA
jgi:hypothetical protein